MSAPITSHRFEQCCHGYRDTCDHCGQPESAHAAPEPVPPCRGCGYPEAEHRDRNLSHAFEPPITPSAGPAPKDRLGEIAVQIGCTQRKIAGTFEQEALIDQIRAALEAVVRQDAAMCDVMADNYGVDFAGCSGDDILRHWGLEEKP